jgi:hypothetical protein
MSNMTPNGFSSSANKGIAPIIGVTLLKAISGALIVESIILIYRAWMSSRKSPFQTK